MQLEGSCHCGAVQFSLDAPHPAPFNLCYCGICRKTAGSGGFAINIGGRYQTLRIDGASHIRVYRARLEDGSVSPAGRSFCSQCGTSLWLWDPRWPELVHPHASAIDTALPAPPERTHLMLSSKREWVVDCLADGDKSFDQYPDESLAAWHERVGLAD